MPDLFDPSLTKPLSADRQYLLDTAIPIITLSAVTTEDLKKAHGLPNNETEGDIVLSRAHYSMAVGVAKQAWDGSPDPKKAWLVDPTNYLTGKNYLSVDLTEEIGKTIARHSILKTIKDFIDKFGRKKLPIIDSVTNPLLYLTQEIKKPILSMHISSGNVLLEQGKTILQVITDPHVREDYLTHANNNHLTWCVFDEATKMELLEKAALLDTDVDPDRVVVTGPPVDPQIVAARKGKRAWRSGKLRLVITTGGLGTNKAEILQICRKLFPRLALHDAHSYPPLQLIVYCATHRDIYTAVMAIAKEYRLTPAALVADSAPLRVMYHPQLTDANNLLLKYAFPWADGFITKPSGDMAYDAAAAGCFLLTLAEWGEWEHAIRSRFEHLEISRKAIPEQIDDQLEVLSSAEGKAQSWIETAQSNALRLGGDFTSGSANIIAAYKKLSKQAT